MTRKKVIQLDECKLNLQPGIRDGAPVVACALIYGTSLIHYLQIDRLMSSLDDAQQFVEAADENTGRELLGEILAVHGHIVDGINRIFGASSQQAAVRYHQLVGNRPKK